MFSNKKGQYLSFDVIVASVIFLMTIVMLMSYWQSMKSTVMNENEYLLNSANLVADNLLTDYSSIGVFKKGTHIIGENEFNGITEDKLKEFSGGDDVFVEIMGGDSDSVPSIGKVPNENDNNNVARVTRIVSAGENGGVRTLNVVVYKKATQ